MALTLLFAVAWPAEAPRAQDVLRIAAVVNDRVISALDVVNRLKFVIMSTGMANTPDNRRRLSPRILRNLIDEELQSQEAGRQNIKVSEADVDKSLLDIEQRNNMQLGQLTRMLRSQGVAESTLRKKLRTQIEWGRAISRRLRREARISEDEIDGEIERITAQRNQPKYRVSELFLSVDDPDQDEEVRRAALKFQEQIKNGADFAALARAFSQSTSASLGGDLGWIQVGRLNRKLDDAILKLEPKQTAGPIRTLSGYYLLLLQDRREPAATSGAGSIVDLHQIVMPATPSIGQAALAAQGPAAEEIRRSIASCADLPKAIEAAGTKESGSLGKVKFKDLPKPLRDAVKGLKIGKPSPPLLSSTDRVIILVVCGRVDPAAKGPSRAAVRRRLRANRLELLSRRYLRDLRRSAFVDLRG